MYTCVQVGVWARLEVAAVTRVIYVPRYYDRDQRAFAKRQCKGMGNEWLYESWLPKP